jgi:hypothetical protein
MRTPSALDCSGFFLMVSPSNLRRHPFRQIERRRLFKTDQSATRTDRVRRGDGRLLHRLRPQQAGARLRLFADSGDCRWCARSEATASEPEGFSVAVTIASMSPSPAANPAAHKKLAMVISNPHVEYYRWH